MIDKKTVLDQLHAGAVVVKFTKVNGDLREMTCTLNKDQLPPIVETKDPKPVRKVNPDVQSVWDCTAKGWRSFRWENVIQTVAAPNE